MPHANEIFFIVAALILWGLALSSKSLISHNKKSLRESYWLIALIFIALSFTLFAITPILHLRLLTAANTCFIAAYVYLGIFCRSLNEPISRQVKTFAILSIVIFGLIFEYIRQTQAFPERVLLITITALIILIWELVELWRLGRLKSIQLRLFIVATIVEFFLALLRLGMLYFDRPPDNINLYQEPFLGALVRWAWFAFATLSYVSIIGYWIEKQSIENTKTLNENIKINSLLEEKESLIYGLMKANKTSATGALSASIAHELNQPLTASNLNIQLLRMKLGKGVLNSEQGNQILDSLEADNQRASTIVKSLRSIFTEGDSSTQEVNLSDSITKVLDLIKPEIKSHNIQIEIKLGEGLVVQVNPSEIEQVILNLLNNAIQSLANKGNSAPIISIEAIKSGQFIQLSIADNGSGVSAEFRPHLFELLNTTKETGMGLGLWLCKHIVSRYGGTIHYEDSFGGGANFVIQLPASTPTKIT